MRKAIFLTLLAIVTLLSCRPPAKSSEKSDAATPETENQADALQQEKTYTDSPEGMKNYEKSQELDLKMGEVYNNNPPGLIGFRLEDEKTPDFIEGVYTHRESGQLVIQISGDSIAGRRELEKTLGTDGYIIEHITKENHVYSQKQLNEIIEQLNKRLNEIKDNPATANVSGYYGGLQYVEIILILNSPEKQREFRQTVMDSPAFRFQGPEEPIPNPVVGVNDTLGINLRPEYDAWSTEAEKVKFILYNGHDEEIQCGDHYFVTFEDENGLWRELPINTFAHDIAYIVFPDKEYTFTANLYPNVHPNKPGRYRFFYDVRISDKVVQMMADFRLTDKREEWESAAKTSKDKR